jgi:hypothetical protein
MQADEVRRQVLDAVAEGRIPKGGPSEIAARDLAAEVPAGYWEHWGRAAADHIHHQMANARCGSEPRHEGGS